MDRDLEEQIKAEELNSWLKHPQTRKLASTLLSERSIIVRELLHAAETSSDPKVSKLHGQLSNLEKSLGQLGQRPVTEVVRVKVEVKRG